MSDDFEQAHERLEEAVEGREEDKNRRRRTAIIIAVMAALLALLGAYDLDEPVRPS